MQVRDDENM